MDHNQAQRNNARTTKVKRSFSLRELVGLLPVTCRKAWEKAGKLALPANLLELSASMMGARREERAFALRNSNFKQQIRLRDLAARFARGFPSISSTLRSEGAGNAGRRCAAAKCARSSHGHTGITRHSPRNGFTAYFVLSPAIGLFCHRRLRDLPQA